MKLRVLLLALVSTGVWAQTPQSFLDLETTRTSASAVGANWAWSRGYTGRGATILIMDSGIDVKNSEFAGRIKYSIDYTGTGIQDRVGHGTHVAGIAAAANNGRFTQGIAYDANVAVAKITNTSSVSMQNAQRALVWAGQYQDIVVANLSANVNYSSAYTTAMRMVSSGMYVNTDKNYGGKNYYNLENPANWRIPGEMVLTVSAGNTRAGYVQSPAVFATATDAAGNLISGGRMLIVGNWNVSLNTVEGAQAGHICKNYTNTCLDRYRTSDFYILAPGSGIVSTGIGETTKTMSGTSQAAPTVAGAVAVVNQMWPYMKGDQIVQLLLKTANKNLKGYNVNVHGQGLLDLNRATQPIGTLGISTTGRTGAVKPLTGGLALSSTAIAGALSSVTVVDGLQRDYRVDMSSMAGKNTLMSTMVTMDVEPATNWSHRWAGVMQNYVPGFNGGQAGANSTLTFDSRIFNPKDVISHQFTMTQSEANPYVAFSGVWGQTKTATTYEYSTLWKPNLQGWWAHGGVMQTTTMFDAGLVEKVSPIYAVHASGGYQIGDWNLFGGVKPTVVSGNITVRLPSAVDADGNMQYNSVKASLVGDNPIGYVGAKWQHNLKDGQVYGFRASVAHDNTYHTRIYYAYRF